MEFYVIFNVFLYLALLLWYKRRNGSIITPGGVLIAQYLLVAICCYFFFRISQRGDSVFMQEKWVLTFWPFPYLFFCFVLLSRYYFLAPPKSFADKPRLIKLLSSLFIFCVFCYIIILAPRLLSNLMSGEWASVYTLSRTADEKIYSNFFERIVMIFCMYFKIPAMAIMFYNLSLKKKNKGTFLLAIAVLIYVFSTSILSASRAHMYVGIVELFVMFLYFYKQIDVCIRRKIILVSIMILSLCMLLIVGITISRVEYKGGSELVAQNFLYYFGHSMLKFNYGVVDTIKVFANGDFFCRSVVGYIPGDAELGTHSDPLFTTLIGALYKDFGPIGTIVVSFIVPLIISLSWRHGNVRTMDLADLTIYFYFFNELLVGVFYENSSILNWVIYFIIYVGLKILKKII